MTKIIPLPRRYAYKDDAQMVADVIADDELATRYVLYEEYDDLLREIFSKCVGDMPIQHDVPVKEFHLYLTENDCAILKLFDNTKMAFDVWLTKKAKMFFEVFSREKLIAAVIAGDNLATKYVFFDKYSGLLHTIFNQKIEKRSLLKDYYDDAVQSFYIHLSKNDWSNLRAYDATKQFSSWLGKVFENFLISDYCRKTYYRVSEFTDDNRIYDTPVNYFDWDNSELMRDLKRVLPEFEPPRDREIIEALIIRDEDKKDIAKRYGLHVDSVSRIFREGIARLVSNYLSDYKK